MEDEILALIVYNGDGGDESNSDNNSSSESVDGELSNSDEEEDGSDEITYDTTLPGTHSYLGDDLEELRGRTIHEDDTLVSLPILSLPGVILLPGQTIPLNLFEQRAVAMMANVVQEENRTFGMVTSRMRTDEAMFQLAHIGTTAEVLAFKEENDEHTGLSTMKMKAIGRQRFEIKKKRRQADGFIMAKVRILPERILADPLDGARPDTHSRVCAFGDLRDPVTTTTTASACSSTAGRIDTRQIRRNKRLHRLDCANFTGWPPWVYKQFDLHHLIHEVHAELDSWNEAHKLIMPTDPVSLSFWIASNLPLDDGLKLHLLTIDSAIQRLRCELSIMRRCTMLSCKICGQLLASKSEMFSMAIEGPMGSYVNPHGHVHEMLTVHQAQGLDLVGRPSEQASWFPGYAWTISQCRHCGQHIGWKFTATTRSLQPQKFWGLCRSSILPSLQEHDSDTEIWRPIM